MNELKQRDSKESWDTYWQGAGAAAPVGVKHAAVRTFWSKALREFVDAHPDGRILDIGTGSGDVIAYLSRVENARLENVSCVDVSQAAIDAVHERFPEVSGIVANATSIPLGDGQYDLLTSQFGIEYAGPSALDEAVRLLAPGGSLLFLMHIKPGELYRESAAAIDALKRTQESDFLNLALQFFEAGFAAVRGADRAPYEDAARKFDPAIRELESILSEHGEHVAGDMLAYLHTTVRRMHQRIQHYDPDEALDWLRSMKKELSMHEERMLSMHDASMDEEMFQTLCQGLNAQGLIVENAVKLMMKEDELPVAWVLQATKPIDTVDLTDD